MQQIATFLMFSGNAEEAMNFYISLFENSSINNILRYGANEMGKEGSVKLAAFSLNGQEFLCIDSIIKHDFTFTPAMSIHVTFNKEADLDHVFSELTKGGHILMPLNVYPFSEKYAWCSDKFGVSWQLNLKKS
ncbi:VOC family protein [Solitalea koreensis]|uniref:Glyoxalase superfamily enzyme, possibly 3-demethylubiquinone-9 3-methyltransferase n=1 Tax=Solitalea koreensis TaxID=543615 RepID=A0A521E515_9SPHI|nr:VOC family protein [Solitalea koreensis]SMO79033.1 Glyoxalase superfamily enzyme, possibly 3-demethylubiquinone-9 3-methyltransferase [Solitalea koreensis]